MQLTILTICCFVVAYSWRVPINHITSRKLRKLRSEASNDRSSGTPFTEAGSSLQNQVVNTNTSQDSKAQAEEIFKVYPFTDLGLPILEECDNFYSGKCRNYFWLQNRGQVLAYLPINDDITKYDVSVEFEPEAVHVKVNEKLLVEFTTPYPINPSGSFWVLEHDKHDKKYIQLDLEKRYGYTNWKYLFEVKKEIQDAADKGKLDLLEKLYAANQGMGKLTGQAPESIESMKNNGIFKMLASTEELNKEMEPTMLTKTDSGLQMVPADPNSPNLVNIVEMFGSKSKEEVNSFVDLLEDVEDESSKSSEENNIPEQNEDKDSSETLPSNETTNISN